MDFQNGTFTSRGRLTDEITELGKVLDTTSYELSSDVVEWLSSESGFDFRTCGRRRPSYDDFTPKEKTTFVGFIAYELELLPETSGGFLDGRRLTRTDQRWAVVPAS